MSRDRSALCLYNMTGSNAMSRDRSALCLHNITGSNAMSLDIQAVEHCKKAVKQASSVYDLRLLKAT